MDMDPTLVPLPRRELPVALQASLDSLEAYWTNAVRTVHSADASAMRALAKALRRGPVREPRLRDGWKVGEVFRVHIVVDGGDVDPSGPALIMTVTPQGTVSSSRWSEPVMHGDAGERKRLFGVT
jgi:hypothetical protein